MSYTQKTQTEWDADRAKAKAKAKKAREAATLKEAKAKLEALQAQIEGTTKKPKADSKVEAPADGKPVESITSKDVGGTPVPVPAAKEPKAAS